MKTLFGKAWEKYVRGVVLYVGPDPEGIGGNVYLYYDKDDSAALPTYSNIVPKEDLINLFKHGEVVIDYGSGGFIRPMGLDISDNYAGVSYVGEGAGGTLSIKYYYSEGYSE